MGLEPSCKTYAGSLVAVEPVYGWGWYRLDAPEIPVSAESQGVPRPFHCRIQDFFCFQNEVRGAIGRVEEAGHSYDDLWVVFSTRVNGDHNFIDRLPYCDVQLGAIAPVGEWPEFTSGSPIVSGYGFVGASFRQLAEHDAKMLADGRGRTGE